MARAGALPLLLGWAAAAAAVALAAAACPDACVCLHDARLWVAHPREDSLTARCVRRGLDAVPQDLSADVRHLELAGNALETLRQNEFAALGLELLLSIDLSGNSIAEVHAGAFSGLFDLRRLYLQHNRITTLPENVLSDCTQLWFLSLAGNPLVIPDAASGKALLSTPSLKVLDLSNSKLNFFPDHILGDNNSLQELVVANNSISEVRVERLKHLRRLDVSDNRLQGLSADALSGAKTLRSLALDGNQLRSGAVQLLPRAESLRSLSVARCGLRRVDAAAFASVPAVEELSLEDNGISELTADVFSALSNLQRLNLRRNRLATLPGGLFTKNAHLRALDLGGNPLKEESLVWAQSSTSAESAPSASTEPATPAAAEPAPPTPWLEAQSLRELSLAHCGLRALPPALFAGVPELRNLSVAHNALQTASAALVAALPRLRFLDLSGNLLRCDAALRPLWLACAAQRVRVTAACFDPPGDWQMLRYVTGDGASSAVQITTAGSAQIVDGRGEDKDEEDDDDITDEIVHYASRWGPPVGFFLVFTGGVLLIRKVLDRSTVKSTYYRSRSKEYVYESEEDEGTTTTMVTDSGSPRVTPTSPALPPHPPPPSPPAARRPAPKRLPDAGKDELTPPLLARFDVTPVAADRPPAITSITTPPVRHSRI